MNISNGSGIRDPQLYILQIEIMRTDRNCSESSVAKDRLSDARGPRFESQTGRVTG